MGENQSDKDCSYWFLTPATLLGFTFYVDQDLERELQISVVRIANSLWQPPDLIHRYDVYVFLVLSDSYDEFIK